MFRLTVGFLALALAVGLTAVGTSQEKDKKKAKGQLPAGWKDLDLSVEQKAKVYELQGIYKGKISKLAQEIKALQAEEKGELVKVLTTDQKTKLAKALIGDTDTKKETPKKVDKKE